MIKDYTTKEIKGDLPLRQKWRAVSEMLTKELEMAKETNSLKLQFKAVMGSK